MFFLNVGIVADYIIYTNLTAENAEWNNKKIFKKKNLTADKMIRNNQAKKLTLWSWAVVLSTLWGSGQDTNSRVNPRKKLIREFHNIHPECKPEITYPIYLLFLPSEDFKESYLHV